MVYEQSASADVFVPALFSPAFEKEIFARRIGLHPVVFSSFPGRSERESACGQGLCLEKAQFILFYGAQVGRSVAVVVRISAVHQGYGAPQCFRHASAFFIVGIVVVRQSERVAEFVAESPYPGQRIYSERTSRQFRSAGISVHYHSVESPLFLFIIFYAKFPGVRPDMVVTGPFRLISSGEEYEYIVHIAVPVIVIAGKVHAPVRQSAGFQNHFGSIYVIFGIFIVAPVVGVVL